MSTFKSQILSLPFQIFQIMMMHCAQCNIGTRHHLQLARNHYSFLILKGYIEKTQIHKAVSGDRTFRTLPLFLYSITLPKTRTQTDLREQKTILLKRQGYRFTSSTIFIFGIGDEILCAQTVHYLNYMILYLI